MALREAVGLEEPVEAKPSSFKTVFVSLASFWKRFSKISDVQTTNILLAQFRSLLRLTLCPGFARKGGPSL